MSTWEAIAQQADDLFLKRDVPGQHKLLKEAYDKGERNPQILWRYGRAKYDVAEDSSDKKVKKTMLAEGWEVCKQAVEALPNDSNTQLWAGNLLGLLGDYLPVKEKVSNAYKVRDYFVKATELNPKDPVAYHSLGRWCWTVLQVGWVERQAASVLFASPPTSTFEDALKYLLESDKLERTIHNSVILVEVYSKMKNKEETRKWCDIVLAFPVKTERCKVYQDEARKKLKSL